MKLELIKLGGNTNNVGTDLSSYRYIVKDLELKKAIKVIKNVFNEDTKKYENKEFYIGKLDYLEITSGARYNNERKCIDYFGVWFGTEYYIENVGSYRLLDLESNLNISNWNSERATYNKQFILDMVNSIAKNEYTEIVEV